MFNMNFIETIFSVIMLILNIGKSAEWGIQNFGGADVSATGYDSTANALQVEVSFNNIPNADQTSPFGSVESYPVDYKLGILDFGDSYDYDNSDSWLDDSSCMSTSGSATCTFSIPQADLGSYNLDGTGSTFQNGFIFTAQIDDSSSTWVGNADSKILDITNDGIQTVLSGQTSGTFDTQVLSANGLNILLTVFDHDYVPDTSTSSLTRIGIYIAGDQSCSPTEVDSIDTSSISASPSQSSNFRLYSIISIPDGQPVDTTDIDIANNGGIIPERTNVLVKVTCSSNIFDFFMDVPAYDGSQGTDFSQAIFTPSITSSGFTGTVGSTGILRFNETATVQIVTNDPLGVGYEYSVDEAKVCSDSASVLSDCSTASDAVIISGTTNQLTGGTTGLTFDFKITPSTGIQNPIMTMELQISYDSSRRRRRVLLTTGGDNGIHGEWKVISSVKLVDGEDESESNEDEENKSNIYNFSYLLLLFGGIISLLFIN